MAILQEKRFSYMLHLVTVSLLCVNSGNRDEGVKRGGSLSGFKRGL